MITLAQTSAVQSLYTLVVLFVAGAWVGLLALRGTLVESCNGNCQTFATYVRHDPYCAIDPACISPFYAPVRTSAETSPQSTPRWQGLAWLAGSGTYDTGLHMLAVPNYIFFMVLLGTVTTIVEWRVANPTSRGLLLAGVTTWLLLDVMRWFAEVANVDPTVPFLNWELVITLTISLLMLWGMTRGAARWFRRPR